MEEMRGASFAGSSPPFLGRERAAVGVDVDPERRSSRYHETCLALESVEESSATVGNPMCFFGSDTHFSTCIAVCKFVTGAFPYVLVLIRTHPSPCTPTRCTLRALAIRPHFLTAFA